MNWEPTHEVPGTGLQAWAEPDPSQQPITTLAAGIRLQRVEERGAWARVVADNGWTAWVDGRALVAVAAAPAAPIVPAAPVAPAPAPTPPNDATIVGGVAPLRPPTASPGPAPVQATPPLVGGGIPSGFSPPSAGTTKPPMTGAAPSTGFTPVQIATAVLGIALAVTFILPWASLGGGSDTAIALANDGRDFLDILETRSQIGVYLMQLLFPALILGPVATILLLIRNSAARGVAIGAGVLGLLVVIGRFLIDLGGGGYGIGTWLGLVVSIALIGLGAAAGSGSGQGASRGW